MKPIPHDSFCSLWNEIELEIQKRASYKDKGFVLTGTWKNYLKTQEHFKIYLVNGEWVRTNLSSIFGHGGHGYVHEFIPHDELWIDTHHTDCVCRNVSQDKKMSESYRESTIIHEITEYKKMQTGYTFSQAHDLALEAERQAGILEDPYAEVS